MGFKPILRMSASTMILTSSLNRILGFQPTIFLILLESAARSSVSVGLKYFWSVLTYSSQFKPMYENACSTNSLTECCSPVPTTKSLACLAEEFATSLQHIRGQIPSHVSVQDYQDTEIAASWQRY